MFCVNFSCDDLERVGIGTFFAAGSWDLVVDLGHGNKATSCMRGDARIVVFRPGRPVWSAAKSVDSGKVSGRCGSHCEGGGNYASLTNYAPSIPVYEATLAPL